MDTGVWRARIDAAGPMAPTWFRGMLARVLADRRFSADALLLVTDALEDAARESEAHGHGALRRDLRALAELSRQLAPTRVAPIPDDSA